LAKESGGEEAFMWLMTMASLLTLLSYYSYSSRGSGSPWGLSPISSAALSTALYSLVDKVGVLRVGPSSTPSG